MLKYGHPPSGMPEGRGGGQACCTSPSRLERPSRWRLGVERATRDQVQVHADQGGLSLPAALRKIGLQQCRFAIMQVRDFLATLQLPCYLTGELSFGAVLQIARS